jgi:hypothetical protein
MTLHVCPDQPVLHLHSGTGGYDISIPEGPEDHSGSGAGAEGAGGAGAEGMEGTEWNRSSPDNIQVKQPCKNPLSSSANSSVVILFR